MSVGGVGGGGGSSAGGVGGSSRSGGAQGPSSSGASGSQSTGAGRSDSTSQTSTSTSTTTPTDSVEASRSAEQTAATGTTQTQEAAQAREAQASVDTAVQDARSQQQAERAVSETTGALADTAGVAQQALSGVNDVSQGLGRDLGTSGAKSAAGIVGNGLATADGAARTVEAIQAGDTQAAVEAGRDTVVSAAQTASNILDTPAGRVGAAASRFGGPLGAVAAANDMVKAGEAYADYVENPSFSSGAAATWSGVKAGLSTAALAPGAGVAPAIAAGAMDLVEAGMGFFGWGD